MGGTGKETLRRRRKRLFSVYVVDCCHREKTGGLVIERFTKRDKAGFPSVKSIANPRKVKDASVHYHDYGWALSVNENHAFYTKGDSEITAEKIRINHYFCKSFEEFCAKRNKGLADRNGLRGMEFFDKNDINDVDDDSMLKYVPAIKKALAERGFNESGLLK